MLFTSSVPSTGGTRNCNSIWTSTSLSFLFLILTLSPRSTYSETSDGVAEVQGSSEDGPRPHHDPEFSPYISLGSKLWQILLQAQLQPQEFLTQLQHNGTALDGTCLLPALCWHQNSVEDQSTSSTETLTWQLANDKDPRQGVPSIPSVVRPGLTLLSFGLTFPFIVADLIMCIITTGLNIASLRDRTVLADLHQAQLDAIAGFAGIPNGVVNADGDDDGGGAPVSRVGMSSIHEDELTSEIQASTKRLEEAFARILGLPYLLRASIEGSVSRIGTLNHDDDLSSEFQLASNRVEEALAQFLLMPHILRASLALLILGTWAGLTLGLFLVSSLSLGWAAIILAPIGLIFGLGVIMSLGQTQSQGRTSGKKRQITPDADLLELTEQVMKSLSYKLM